MPVRNAARWLGNAIKSVQDQTFRDFELIVIDDGSDDKSPRIIDERFRSDPRIIAIRQDRLGLVAALNSGLVASRGQFIARLDADDLAKPQRLERQNEYLENHPEIGLLGSWAEKINEQGLIVGTLRPPADSRELSSLLARTNPFLHSSIMMRKTILEAAGAYRAAFDGAEDYDLWMRMSEIAGIANLPDYLLQYRVHPDSVTHTHRVRQLFSARLARQAAEARRNSGRDPTSELTAPPNWHATEFAEASTFSDIAKLFQFLDLADARNLASVTTSGFDISPLNDRNLALNHAERRMAQHALLNLLKNKQAAQIPRRDLLWHFFQLHPARAIELGYRALRGTN